MRKSVSPKAAQSAAKKVAQQLMQEDVDRDKERMKAIQRLTYSYQQKREHILGSELCRRIHEMPVTPAPERFDAQTVRLITETTRREQIEFARRSREKLYVDLGVDLAALRALDADFALSLRVLNRTATPFERMTEVSESLGTTDSSHPEIRERLFRNEVDPALRISSPLLFRPPFGTQTTIEGFSLAERGVLGAHGDMTDSSIGQLGANLFMAHLWDYTSNGDNFNYSRDTGMFVGSVGVSEPSFLRVTVRVLCETSIQNYSTEHTPWWDPRDSDSQVDLTDLLFVGIRRSPSSSFPEPETLISVGDLASLRAHEDDGWDNRLVRNPGDLLTYSVVFPRIITPAEHGDCPFVFVGLKHYAFFWGKHVKFHLQSACRWNIVDVTVDNA